VLAKPKQLGGKSVFHTARFADRRTRRQRRAKP
jgi:hypothetical protein